MMRSLLWSFSQDCAIEPGPCQQGSEVVSASKPHLISSDRFTRRAAMLHARLYAQPIAAEQIAAELYTSTLYVAGPIAGSICNPSTCGQP